MRSVVRMVVNSSAHPVGVSSAISGNIEDFDSVRIVLPHLLKVLSIVHSRRSSATNDSASSGPESMSITGSITFKNSFE